MHQLKNDKLQRKYITNYGRYVQEIGAIGG